MARISFNWQIFITSFVTCACQMICRLLQSFLFFHKYIVCVGYLSCIDIYVQLNKINIQIKTVKNDSHVIDDIDW